MGGTLGFHLKLLNLKTGEDRMVQPTIPSSIPANSVLPSLVARWPVEHLRNNGVRPITVQGITATDEDSAIEGEIRDPIRIA